MENQISFQSMKNEMVEIRNENRRIVEKLDITQRSMDSQNFTIISLSEELKTVKKEMCIYAKQKRHMDSILEEMVNKIDSIDNSNNNDNYTSDTLINNDNDFENILDNNTIIQETLIKTEMQEEIEDNSTFNEHEDNIYYNIDDIKMTDTLNFRENLLCDIPVINKEIKAKTEMNNQFEQNINESLEKGSTNKETNYIEEQNSLNYDDESASQFNLTSISSSKPQSSNLNRQRNINSDIRPFKCYLCLKAFEYPAHLNLHLRIHTGDRPFQCSYCSKRFKQSSSLNVHLKIHTGENLFKCDICSKTFTSSSNFKRHLNVH